MPSRARLILYRLSTGVIRLFIVLWHSKASCSQFQNTFLQISVRLSVGTMLSLGQELHICSFECPELTKLLTWCHVCPFNILNPFKMGNSFPGMLGTTGILLLSQTETYSVTSLVPSFWVGFGDKQILYLCHYDKDSLFFPLR